MSDFDAILEGLGADERRVVLHVASRIADRLRMGAKQYGALHLATDTRNWREEVMQEGLDLLVYAACDALKGDGK